MHFEKYFSLGFGFECLVVVGSEVYAGGFLDAGEVMVIQKITIKIYLFALDSFVLTNSMKFTSKAAEYTEEKQVYKVMDWSTLDFNKIINSNSKE